MKFHQGNSLVSVTVCLLCVLCACVCLLFKKNFVTGIFGGLWHGVDGRQS